MDPASHPNAELPPWEKIKKGIKLTEEEKVQLREYRAKQPKPEVKPITLEELEEANDKILKRIMGTVGSVPAKELPKMLEIVRTAITERKAKGEKGKEETKAEPTRKEMLEALQGRRLVEKS